MVHDAGDSISPRPPAGPPVAPAPPLAMPIERWSRRRVWLARGLAVGVDLLQIVLLPLVLGGAASPVADVLDVVTGVALWAMLGWHWAFLPSFLTKLVPIVDVTPTWTIAVLFVTRKKRLSTRPPA